LKTALSYTYSTVNIVTTVPTILPHFSCPTTDLSPILSSFSQIRISVSSICYHREIFPGTVFKRREYGSDKMSTHIYTLEPAVVDGKDVIVRNQDAFNVTQWLEKGVFKALEDQYLDQLTFAIFTTHPVSGEDLLLETYEFNCTYPGVTADGKRTKAKVNQQSLDKYALKSQANKFVRSLIEFSSTLDSIPEERWITMELAYTANCPDDYQPEYFTDNTGNGIGFFEGTRLLKIRVGNIKTDHHDLNVRFKGREHLDRESLSLFEDGAGMSVPSGLPQQQKDEHALPDDDDEHAHNATDAQGRVRSRSSSSFRASAPALAQPAAVPVLPPYPPQVHSYSSRMVPETEPMDDDDDDKSSNEGEEAAATPPSEITAIDSVRAFVLTVNRSVVKEASKALSLPLVETRRCFQALVHCGFLKERSGSGYLLADRTAIMPALSQQASWSAGTGERAGAERKVTSRASRKSPAVQHQQHPRPSALLPAPGVVTRRRGATNTNGGGNGNEGSELDDAQEEVEDSETQALSQLDTTDHNEEEVEMSDDDSMSEESVEYVLPAPIPIPATLTTAATGTAGRQAKQLSATACAMAAVSPSSSSSDFGKDPRAGDRGAAAAAGTIRMRAATAFGKAPHSRAPSQSQSQSQSQTEESEMEPRVVPGSSFSTVGVATGAGAGKSKRGRRDTPFSAAPVTAAVTAAAAKSEEQISSKKRRKTSTVTRPMRVRTKGDDDNGGGGGGGGSQGQSGSQVECYTYASQ
jgi:hypothetical protein